MLLELDAPCIWTEIGHEWVMARWLLVLGSSRSSPSLREALIRYTFRVFFSSDYFRLAVRMRKVPARPQALKPLGLICNKTTWPRETAGSRDEKPDLGLVYMFHLLLTVCLNWIRLFNLPTHEKWTHEVFDDLIAEPFFKK